MGISRKVLVDERSTLKKTFDDLQSKINLIDKESTALKNNLNAVGGAIQQIDKLLHISAESGKNLPPEEREQTKSLDISQSKKELLKEGEK